MEFTLLRIGEEFRFPTSEKDFSDLGDVIGKLESVGINDEIIKICCEELIEEIIECVIHEMLESSQSICETELHDEPFKRSVLSCHVSVPVSALRSAPGPHSDFSSFPDLYGLVDPGFPK